MIKTLFPLDKLLAGVKDIPLKDMTETEKKEYKSKSIRKQYLYLLEGILNDYTCPLNEELVSEVVSAVTGRVLNLSKTNNIYELDVKSNYCTKIQIIDKERRIVDIIE